MKYLHRKFILFILLGFIVVSCTSQPITSSIPSSTIEVINTLRPTSTLTATPAFISTKTPTPFTKDLTETSPNSKIRRALVSSNGKFVVFATLSGFYIYDLEKLKIIRFIETDSEIGDVAISPDSQILAIGTQAKMLVYSLNDGDLLTTINQSVTNLVFSPDGQKIAVGMGDWKWCRGGTSLELWQVSNWSLLQTLPSSNRLDCFSGLTFSPSGTYLAASAFEVLVWEIGEDSSILKVRSQGCDVFEASLAFTSNEKTLVAGTLADSGRNVICLIRLADGETLGALDKANKSDYSCGSQVLISPDGELMASNLDGKVTIWQIGDWKQIQSLNVEENCPQLSGWFPDGKILTFLLPDGSLQFLSTQTGKIIHSVSLTNQ